METGLGFPKMIEKLEIEAIWFKISNLTELYLDVENLQYVPKPFESNWLTGLKFDPMLLT